MIPDLNCAFRYRNYNRPQTIDQNKIIMQIKKGPVPYGVKVLKYVNKLITSLKIKLVNIRLCECSW